jgi:hypothetical protein
MPYPWILAGRCLEGVRFEIAGENVWSHKWHAVPGEGFETYDPTYCCTLTVRIYEIRADGKVVKFGAAEQSANVYAFWELDRPS